MGSMTGKRLDCCFGWAIRDGRITNSRNSRFQFYSLTEELRVHNLSRMKVAE